MIKQLFNSVLAKYRDLSVSRRSIICLCLRHRQIIDLLATHKSRYFARPRAIIDKYWRSLICNFDNDQPYRIVSKTLWRCIVYTNFRTPCLPLTPSQRVGTYHVFAGPLFLRHVASVGNQGSLICTEFTRASCPCHRIKISNRRAT